MKPFRYFKRPWDEPRGDQFDGWGTSDWYFEVDGEGYPVRQVERYVSGPVLKYDAAHLDDEYGGLGEQPLDLTELEGFEIDAAAFETAWSWEALNRRRE